MVIHVTTIAVVLAILAATSGGSAAPVASDLHLKTGIKSVETAANGMPLHTYGDKGHPECFKGDAAPDALRVAPHAVHKFSNGHLAVDFNEIGRSMTRLAK